MPLRTLGFLIVFLVLLCTACGDATATVSTLTQTPVISPVAIPPAPTAAGGTMAPMPGMGQDSTPPALSDSDPMTASLQTLTGQAFETAFMQEMIAHHQGAVDMAQLVPTRTTRPALIQLSHTIIAAQTTEIAQMTGWLAQWDNATPLADPMSAPGMMAMMRGMEQLKAAKNAAFDTQFLAMMIPHHQTAVSMAQLVAHQGLHPELKTLATAIITAQTQEIAQMRSWQIAWGT